MLDSVKKIGEICISLLVKDLAWPFSSKHSFICPRNRDEMNASEIEITFRSKILFYNMNVNRN